MKVFVCIVLLSVSLCLVNGDIKIRRRRQLEKEEERHEEVIIKNGNNDTVEVDVEEDDDGRDVLKFFLDDLPFRRPLYPMMSDFGIDLASLLIRMQQMAEMANAFQSRMNDLPVISNETDTENIEINGRKFIKTVNTVVKGDKDMKISLHTITLRPADGDVEDKPDPNEYEVASSNDKKSDSDAKKPETEVKETTPKSESKPEKDQLERETRRRKRWAMCTQQNCESHVNSKMLPLLEMRQNQGDADSAVDGVTPPSDILPWEEDLFPSPPPPTSPPPPSSSPSPPTTPSPLTTSPPKQPIIPVVQPTPPPPVQPQPQPQPQPPLPPTNPTFPAIPIPGPIFPIPQQPSYPNQDSIFNLRPAEGPKFDPYWPPFPPRFYPSFVPQRYRLLV